MTPATATVPTNIPWFVLTSPTNGSTATTTLSLTNQTSGASVPLAFEPLDAVSSRVLIPSGLEEDVEYAFTYPNECPGGPPIRQVFRTVAAIPFPDSLGTTTASEIRVARLPPIQGSQLMYFVEVKLEPDPAFLPWAALYRTLILVDGQSQVAFEGRVQVDCLHQNISTLILPGSHEIAHEARFPADDTMILETEAVAVDLDCSDAVRVDAATGTPLTPEQIEMEDAASRATTAPDTDAGTCSVLQRRSTAPAWLLGVPALWIVRRLRHRRPRRG